MMVIGASPIVRASTSPNEFHSILPPDYVVEVEWLSRNIHHSHLIIIDVRDAKEYAQAHILGAVNIPVNSTFSSEITHSMVASISTIQHIFSSAGVSNNSDIVLYDDGEYVDAAREFWVLEVYGHKHVSILNGGFKLWSNRQFKVTQDVPELAHGNFVPTIVPEILSTKFSTRLAINDHSKQLIDVRSRDEFNGLKSETNRFGHIPTAINIPSNMNYSNNAGINKIKPLPDLKLIYNSIDPHKKIIAYCNKGRESALTYFVLKRLGFNVSTYDGSWYEWSSDFELPIVTPASADQ